MSINWKSVAATGLLVLTAAFSVSALIGHPIPVDTLFNVKGAFLQILSTLAFVATLLPSLIHTLQGKPTAGDPTLQDAEKAAEEVKEAVPPNQSGKASLMLLMALAASTVLVLSATGCANSALTKSTLDPVETSLATAEVTLTGLQSTTNLLLINGEISVNEAFEIAKKSDAVHEALKVARGLAPNPENLTPLERLKKVETLLTELQNMVPPLSTPAVAPAAPASAASK